VDQSRVQNYLIKEFQRLKEDESRRLSLAWNLNRTLSKLNYRIHTDAVKQHLIPAEVLSLIQREIEIRRGETKRPHLQEMGLFQRETVS
jgi:hypothetical protein